MAKVRVAILGTVGKAVFLDPDATNGATIGLNLRLPDGTVPSLKRLAEIICSYCDTPVAPVTNIWKYTLEIPENIKQLAELDCCGILVRDCDVPTGTVCTPGEVIPAEQKFTTANWDASINNPEGVYSVAYDGDTGNLIEQTAYMTPENGGLGQLVVYGLGAYEGVDLPLYWRRWYRTIGPDGTASAPAYQDCYLWDYKGFSGLGTASVTFVQNTHDVALVTYSRTGFFEPVVYTKWFINGVPGASVIPPFDTSNGATGMALFTGDSNRRRAMYVEGHGVYVIVRGSDHPASPQKTGIARYQLGAATHDAYIEVDDNEAPVSGTLIGHDSSGNVYFHNTRIADDTRHLIIVSADLSTILHDITMPFTVPGYVPGIGTGWNDYTMVIANDGNMLIGGPASSERDILVWDFSDRATFTLVETVPRGVEFIPTQYATSPAPCEYFRHFVAGSADSTDLWVGIGGCLEEVCVELPGTPEWRCLEITSGDEFINVANGDGQGADPVITLNDLPISKITGLQDALDSLSEGSGGILPMTTGEVPPVLVYGPDGSLIYFEV